MITEIAITHPIPMSYDGHLSSLKRFGPSPSNAHEPHG